MLFLGCCLCSFEGLSNDRLLAIVNFGIVSLSKSVLKWKEELIQRSTCGHEVMN